MIFACEQPLSSRFQEETTQDGHCARPGSQQETTESETFFVGYSSTPKSVLRPQAGFCIVRESLYDLEIVIATGELRDVTE